MPAKEYLSGAQLGPAAFEVGGHRDIHLLGMRQPQIFHVAGEIALANLTAETRVEAALLADAGDRQFAIVVRGIGGGRPEILRVPLS